MDYLIVLLSVTVGLLLISTILPWLVVSLFGQRSFTALDNLQLLANGDKESTGAERVGGDIVMSDLMSVYPNSSSAFLLSMAVLLPGSIVLAAASLFFAVWSRKKTGGLAFRVSTVALLAGILAIATGLAWIYSIESFKSQFSRDAESLGGIVGEEWKGKADLFVNSLIVIGIGQYFVIAAGVIAIFSYIIYRSQLNQERSRTLKRSFDA